MMLNFSRFVVLTLFAVQSLAKPSIYEDFADYEEFDEWPRNVGVPGTAEPTSSSEDKCKKDILLVLDMSSSLKSGIKNVKKFLKEFIDSEDLNVGTDGTHFAVITFSDKDTRKTKVQLEFGVKTTKESLKDFIDNGLPFADLTAFATRTDLALKIADTEVFTKTSPKNARQRIDDIMILFTDGKPTGGPYNIVQLAKDSAKSLKDKNVLIVGIAAGDPRPEKADQNPKDFIASIATSASYTFNTTLSGLSGIVQKLVDKSCWKREPDCEEDPTQPKCNTVAFCECAKTEAAVEYVKSGESSPEIHWEKPPLICSPNQPEIVDEVVDPAGTESPKSFPIGNHVISYTYKYKNGGNFSTHTCFLEVQVKVCDCPSKDMGVFYARPNFPTCLPHFEVPEPNCAGLSVGGGSTGVVPDPFQIGKHTRTYGYVMTNGMKVDCHLNFEIKVIPCGDKDYKPDKEVCCQGQLHAKKNQWECCGSNYFNTADQKCC